MFSFSMVVRTLSVKQLLALLVGVNAKIELISERLRAEKQEINCHERVVW